MSGFQSEQPVKPGNPEARAPEAGQKLPGKPAWKWSVQERLAKRFDPEEMKARATQQAAERKAVLMPQDESDPLWQIPADRASTMLIEGRKTPELFLTWELFNSLLNRAFPSGDEYAEELRRPIEERAAALGFGRDLWPRLRNVAEPLLKLEADQERLQRSTPVPAAGYKLDARSVHFCRVRAQAIAGAKAEFGEEAFLRLLYEALAPEVQLIYGPIDPELAGHLRFLEGGCR